MYRNLSATMAQLEVSGFSDLAAKLLLETSKQVITARKYPMEFSEPKQAKRLQRLLYELFHFYPTNKQRISFTLSDNNLIIKIKDREEQRGRKGLKRPF
jgi:hypothetical protein